MDPPNHNPDYIKNQLRMGQQTSTITDKPHHPSASRIVLCNKSPIQMYVNHTKIGTTEDQGNGLFSTVNLNPGDSIIIIHKPLLLIAENQALHRICAECFVEGGEGVELKPCSGCGVVRFCCDDCEKSSLKPEGSHKAECAFLKSSKPFEHSRAQISAQAVTNTLCGYSECRWPKKATINCRGCKAVNYCSMKCEIMDRSFHEQQCKSIQSQSLGLSLNKILPTAVRATLQFLGHPTALAKASALRGLSSHEYDIRKNQSKWDDTLLQAHAVIKLLQLKPEFIRYALEALGQVNIPLPLFLYRC